MSVDLIALLTDGLLGAALPRPALLPDEVELRTQLGDQPQQWRSLIVAYLDAHVAPRYRALPSNPVRGAPMSAAQRWDLTPRIQQALRAPSALGAWARPDTNHLPLATLEHPDYKLRRFREPDDVLAGFALLGEYLSSVSLPASAYGSRAAATQSLNRLCALDAFLVRWSAAISAAAATNTSLAEVLALYRTEGDLVAPLSQAHVQERRPVAEWLEDINLNEPHRTVILPTMRRGLWSYPVAQVFDAPLVWPPNSADKAAKEGVWKAVALLHWMLVIGGLDFVAQRVPAPLTPQGVRDSIVEFMVENRAGHGQPHDMVVQQTRYDALWAGLVLTWPAASDGRVVVVPQTPEALVAFVLTEAVLFFGLDKDWGQGPFIEPPSALRYLAYNLQHARSNAVPDFDRFIHLLASAAVAANRQSSATFAALKARLAPLALRPELKNDPEVDPLEHVEEFDTLSLPPSAFLDDPANVDLLADFVLRAEHGHWRAFKKNRGNLARYRTLLAFYSALLA